MKINLEEMLISLIKIDHFHQISLKAFRDNFILHVINIKIILLYVFFIIIMNLYLLYLFLILPLIFFFILVIYQILLKYVIKN